MLSTAWMPFPDSFLGISLYQNNFMIAHIDAAYLHYTLWLIATETVKGRRTIP
jgi:hypothetical protein